MSLDELINAAFSFYGVDKSDKKRVFVAKSKKTLAEMDDESLEYLKSKWSVNVVELDRKIWKEKQKLSRKARKQTIYRTVIRKMQMGEEMLTHLIRNNAPQEVVNIQKEALATKKAEFAAQEENVFTLTDDEIYLQQLKIDDMNRKKELRLDKLKEFEKIAA